jgi:hypothetical protein
MTFAERYGPWAEIPSASEGTGRAFARHIAAQGTGHQEYFRRALPRRNAIVITSRGCQSRN